MSAEVLPPYKPAPWRVAVRIADGRAMAQLRGDVPHDPASETVVEHDGDALDDTRMRWNGSAFVEADAAARAAWRAEDHDRIADSVLPDRDEADGPVTRRALRALARVTHEDLQRLAGGSYDVSFEQYWRRVRAAYRANLGSGRQDV